MKPEVVDGKRLVSRFHQGRIAIVGAHPDDEVLWAGGLIEMLDWCAVDVVCCCVPRKEPLRAINFFRVVKALRAFPVLLPYVESPVHEAAPCPADWDWEQYDLVVTHNVVGEYGHAHHRSMHLYMMAAAKGEVWTFGYGLPDTGVEGALTAHTYAQKTAALRQYDHASAATGEPKHIELGRVWSQAFPLHREWFVRAK